MKKRRRHSKPALPMSTQAGRWIRARANRGFSKASGKTLRSDRTVMRYQGDLQRAATWIQSAYKVHRLKDIKEEHAQAYLNRRSKEKLHRRTLLGYSAALRTLPQVGYLTIPITVTARKQQPSRAHTDAQANAVQGLLPIAASLSVQIIRESGCRAQDLASIRLAAKTRLRRARIAQLDPARFAGREDWVKVQFMGKGGHEYISTILPETAIALEKRRLAVPQDFYERSQPNPVCQQYYDLPAGKRLSRLWTNASKKAMGRSFGIHGLRHSYAQQRLEALERLGFEALQAKICTSQTMGHYRASEIDTYLR